MKGSTRRGRIDFSGLELEKHTSVFRHERGVLALDVKAEESRTVSQQLRTREDKVISLGFSTELTAALWRRDDLIHTFPGRGAGAEEHDRDGLHGLRDVEVPPQVPRVVGREDRHPFGSGERGGRCGARAFCGPEDEGINLLHVSHLLSLKERSSPIEGIITADKGLLKAESFLEE